MEAAERQVAQILTEKLRYEIPPYQRPYAWQRSNVEQLLNDVLDAQRAGDEEYFIGSLITIEKERGSLFEVVDGQQRLTTLNLIFARLRDKTLDTYAKADLENRVSLPKLNEDDDSQPRLTIRQKDQGFFAKHVLGGIPISEAQLRELEAKEDKPKLNFAENIAAVDEFLDGLDAKQMRSFKDFLLTKVYVVVVSTKSLKSAYRLFNVLNARGVQLSNADLIKNKLFGALVSGKRSDELEENWLQLEDAIGIERLDQFLGHHRTSLKAEKASKTLQEEYEPLIKESSSPFEFVEQLISSAKNYSRILSGEGFDVASRRALRSLQRVAFEEWISPLLAFLNAPVPALPIFEFIELLEKITYQNWIRRLAFTARLTVYYQLIAAIRDRKCEEEVRAIVHTNANNAETWSLLDGEVYGKPFAQAVLLRLEEADQDVSVTKSYGSQITIEHVLPRTMTDTYWTSRFSSEQHREWIDRLGNLALLMGRKNYQAQNWDFERKKSYYSTKNSKVSFDTTKPILTKPNWTLAEIEERQDIMMVSAKRIWNLGA